MCNERVRIALFALFGIWVMYVLLGTILTALVVFLVPVFDMNFMGIFVFGLICGTVAFITNLMEK